MWTSGLPAHFSRTATPHPIDHFKRGIDMKYILIFSILASLLGGCAIVPTGYSDNRGYYQERGYYRGDGNYYRDRDYNRGDGYYRDFSREHGG
jgi:hypothetical protein